MDVQWPSMAVGFETTPTGRLGDKTSFTTSTFGGGGLLGGGGVN